jgi:hypothetical protein
MMLNFLCTKREFLSFVEWSAFVRLLFYKTRRNYRSRRNQGPLLLRYISTHAQKNSWMTYINPFDLFQIDSSQPAIVNTALARLLQQLDQSGQPYIAYHHHQLTPKDLHDAANALTAPKRAAFHKFVLKHPLLHQYLTDANTRFWSQYEPSLLFDNKHLQRFIAPYFTEATQKVIVALFEQKDESIWRAFVTCPLIKIQPDDAPFWQELEKHLATKLAYQRALYSSFKRNAKCLPAKVAALFSTVTDSFSVPLLNLLPKFFDDWRGKIATLWADWAYLFYTRFPNDSTYFYQIIRTAYQLEVRPAVRARLQEDLQRLRTNWTERRIDRAAHTDHWYKAQLQWVKQVNDGILLAQTSPERISQILDEQFLPETLPVAQPVPVPQSLLSQELLKLAHTFWLRWEDILLYSKTIGLALSMSPKPSTGLNDSGLKNGALVSEALIFLKMELRLKIREGVSLEDANKYMRLLKALFDQPLLATLSQTENITERRALFDQFIPVAHQLRRYAPVGVLQLLDHLDPVIRKDAMLRRVTDTINDRIVQDLEKANWKAGKRKRSWTEVPDRDPLDRVTVFQNAGDTLLRVRAFLMDANTSGPHRLVYLAMLIVLTGGFGLASLGVGTLLTKTYDVKVENPDYLKFVNDRATKAPKFVRERSKYIGNQLKNGATPYDRCFETTVYDFDSGNQLFISNQLEEDAVALIYDPIAKQVIRHQYIQAGKEGAFYHLPKGEYTTKFYVGKDWNPLKPNFCGTHGAFDTNPHYLKRSRKEAALAFQKGTTEKIYLGVEATAGGFKTISISASSFFYQKILSWPPSAFED